MTEEEKAKLPKHLRKALKRFDKAFSGLENFKGFTLTNDDYIIDRIENTMLLQKAPVYYNITVRGLSRRYIRVARAMDKCARLGLKVDLFDAEPETEEAEEATPVEAVLTLPAEIVKK